MDTSRESAKGKWLEQNLKGLREDEIRFTSKSTTDYNCVGFVVGDYLWWHPEEQREHYWPPGVARDFKIETYIAALATVHFEESPIQSPQPEPGYEKIAIFGFGGKFRHVAAVANAKLWRSKLGEYEDLEHPPCPKRMGKYGFVTKYLRREIKYAGDPLPDEYKIS